MAEIITEPIEGENGNEQYIAAIEELKKNTVSKEAYEKLRGENQKLLNSLVNGEKIDLPEETKPDIAALRADLYGGKELSNLEYVEKTLALRDALIESGERDPFLPTGDRVTVTAEQVDAANRVAECLKSCVDFAEGDSGIFTAEVQRRTKDVNIPRGRGR